MNIPTNKILIRITMALLLGASQSVMSTSAIDFFMEGQDAADVVDGGTGDSSSSATGIASIVGGQRDISANAISGANDIFGTDGICDSGDSCSRMEIGGGVLSFNNDASFSGGVVGEGIIQWDGPDQSIELVPDGIGIDLTQGGSLAGFEFNILSSDHAFEYTVEAYTNATHFTKVTIANPEVSFGSPITKTIEFAFLEDPASCGTSGGDIVSVECGPEGNVDFSNFGAMQFRLNTNRAAALDVTISQIDLIAGKPALGDFVWEDCNGNGIQDQADCNGDGVVEPEPGIPDVTVNLLSPGNDGVCGTGDETFISTTTTTADGSYLFSELAADNYCVEFMKPTGFQCSPANQGLDDAVDSDVVDQGDGTCQTVDPAQNPISLDAGESDLTWDAGLVRPASLGDRAWNDLNPNDVQDGGDADLAGVTVTLLDCDGNQITTDLDGNPIGPVTTGADGAYSFTNLAPGGYKVRFAPPAGFTFVTPKVGGDDAVDSDAVPQGDGTGLTACTTLVSGENNPDIDAGLKAIAESRLGDLVWHDLDADGIQDNINGAPDGEPGIPNVTVELWQCDASGTPTINTGLTQTTNDSGFYVFENLAAGSYAVKFPVDAMKAAGWKVSPQNSGLDDSIDSDADPMSGFTACVELGVGEENLDQDAGFYKPASLGDFVWDDDSVTRNDVQDPGEAGVANAVVSLEDCSGNPVTDADGNPIGPVTTGADGAYHFTNLVPGGYKVRFAPPMDYQFVVQNAGAENVDSNAILQADGTGLTDCIVLISGENNPDIDAGLFKQIANCGCDGKVTSLTLQYNGPATAFVEVYQKKGGLVFSGNVAPGEQFSFSGTDKNGTLGTEISIYVNGDLHTKIHTSCSQPIGPGLVAGDFTVIDGSSRNIPQLCPVDQPPEPPVGDECGCDGKVSDLTLQYLGTASANIKVVQKKSEGDGVVFEGNVAPGGRFSFTGEDKKGTLSTEISIYVDGVLNTKIHTSCSQPIGPGLVSGDFMVIAGTSRNGGNLCPIEGK